MKLENDKNVLWEFFWKIIIVLTICIIAMIWLNNYVFKSNFDDIGGNIGALGGALQGTLGVAAALAGAFVAIKLAYIAINLSTQQIKISEQQLRNGDFNYRLAIETRTQLAKFNAGHHIFAVSYSEVTKGVAGAEVETPKFAKDIIKDAITSNALLQFIAENKINDNKYLLYNNIKKLLNGLDALPNEKMDASDIKNNYIDHANPLIKGINGFIEELIKTNEDPKGVKPNISGYLYYLSVHLKECSLLEIK
jgi:hypothetical protein